jgi:hypothetical protein
MLLLIEWWLDHNMPYPPHHMAKIYEQLITGATLNVVLNPAPESPADWVDHLNPDPVEEVLLSE